MKIGVAQTRPIKGDIEKNIDSHQQFIDLAVSNRTDMIFFPELSLTGYEPKLAKTLATTPDDTRFDPFQTLSDRHHIRVGVGMPTRCDAGILISMILFQPNKPRQTYSKQILHADEFPYFVPGQEQIILTAEENTIAPAICYESLQLEHAAGAAESGASIYVASVAKSANGVAKAVKHYPEIAKRYSMTVLMSNCLGPCDDFESVGQSAVWNQDGTLVSQLDDATEALLIYDTESKTATELGK